MRMGAAIGAILVLCSTAGAAWSAPISYVVSPGSGTLTVGDTVTVSFTFDPSQVSFPPFEDQSRLTYSAGVYFDDRYFAFTSRSGIPSVDADDSVFYGAGTFVRHEASSYFFFVDHTPFKSAFTYSETFTAIGGTPETDVLTGFQPAASVGTPGRAIVNVGAFEYYDVTPHVPEPTPLALSSIALAALSAWRTRKSRRRL